MPSTVVSAINVPLELQDVFDSVMTRGLQSLGAENARLLYHDVGRYLLLSEFLQTDNLNMELRLML